MADFDRDALAAAAAGSQSNNNGKLFWALVIALPVIGIIAGLAFLPGGSKPPAPMVLGAVDSPEITPPEPAAQTPAQTDSAAQTWSADGEMQRYTTARSAMLACTNVMATGIAYDVWRKFTDRNNLRFERLREIKQAEYQAAAGGRRAALKREHNQMLLKTITGQAQAEAMGQFSEISNMMQDMEDARGQSRTQRTSPEVLHFLGGEPDLKICSKLSAQMQRGLYDIKFEAS